MASAVLAPPVEGQPNCSLQTVYIQERKKQKQNRHEKVAARQEICLSPHRDYCTETSFPCGYKPALSCTRLAPSTVWISTFLLLFYATLKTATLLWLSSLGGRILVFEKNAPGSSPSNANTFPTPTPLRAREGEGTLFMPQLTATTLPNTRDLRNLTLNLINK